jgi:hypothetical protein
MPDENQKVVIMNAAVPVEAEEPLPVKVTEIVSVTADTISRPDKYVYEVVVEVLSTNAETAAQAIKNGIQGRLNGGWDLHQISGLFSGSGPLTIQIYRKPK